MWNKSRILIFHTFVLHPACVNVSEYYNIHLRNTHKTILVNNKYPPHINKNRKFKNKIKHNAPNPTQKWKWATFTYIGKETRTIARLFRNTNLWIGCITKNTIQYQLQPRKPNADKYSKSGIYQLSCNECPLKYIGQTGRNFRTRYKEHVQAIWCNKPNSKYSQHTYNTMTYYTTKRRE
jgi:hypothetical protein